MSGIEQELKLRLPDQTEYDRLCAALPGFAGEKAQSNHYYDLPGEALRRARVLLRLRFEGERAFVTSKRRAERDREGVFRAVEDEEEVPLAEPGELERLPGAVTRSGVVERLVEEFGGHEFRRWGFLHNVRRRYRLSEHTLVEVDRTSFPGDRTEWEVEVETDDLPRARAELEEVLRAHAIATEPQEETKAERLARYAGRGDPER